MSTEQNKMLVRRYYDEVFNQGKYDVMNEIHAPNYKFHLANNPPNLPDNREGLRQIIMAYRQGLPDLHFTIDDIIAEGDRVVCRWTVSGTQTGEMLGIPPTNKRATVTGTDVERVENGKLVEGWGVFDQLGLLQQLGVVPRMTQPSMQTGSQAAGQSTSTGRPQTGQRPSTM